MNACGELNWQTILQRLKEFTDKAESHIDLICSDGFLYVSCVNLNVFGYNSFLFQKTEFHCKMKWGLTEGWRVGNSQTEFPVILLLATAGTGQKKAT
jgi:hypothetical protein